MAELKQLWENDRLEFHGSAAPYKITILQGIVKYLLCKGMDSLLQETI